MRSSGWSISPNANKTPLTGPLCRKISTQTKRRTIKLVKKGRAMRKRQKLFHLPGIMLMQLNGAAAGQSVFHIHFHILPRHAGIDMKLHAREMVDPKTLEPLAAKIRAALD